MWAHRASRWTVLFASLWLVWGCRGPDEQFAGENPSGSDDDQMDDDDDADDDSADDDTGDDDDTDDPYVQPDVYVTPTQLKPGDPAIVHYRGVLADADNLYLNYGYDGWTSTMPDIEMTANLGGFKCAVYLPDDMTAMHFTFYSEEDGDWTWDDNNDLEYHWSVDFPYIGPYLTWDDTTDPAAGVVVNFETSLPCKGRVEYGTTADMGSRRTGTEFGRLHHIALTGLEPDTDYYYRVLDSEDRRSKALTFHTAEADAEAFTFGALSDIQDSGYYRWDDVADELAFNHTDVDFFVVVGDMPSGASVGRWWTFFHRGRELFSSTPIMPAVGNNDGWGWSDFFSSYFALPNASGVEDYYRFDYGPAAFMAFNTEENAQVADGGVQDDWLELQLEELQTTFTGDWAFAYWHVPVYNAGSRHDGEQFDVRALVEHVDGVLDWVISGHEHLGHRMKPLQYEGVLAASGQYGNGPGDGVGYLTLPPAGTNPSTSLVGWDSEEAYYRDWVAWPELDPIGDTVDNEVGFAKFYIDGQTLTLEIWGLGTTAAPVDAHIRDSITYTK